MKPTERLLFIETTQLAVEFWGPEGVSEAVEPLGNRRRYPRLEVTTDDPFAIFPDSPASHPLFFENAVYSIVARAKQPGQMVSIRHRDPLIEQCFHPSKADSAVVTGTFSFRNQVGFSTFEFWINNRRHLALEIEVFPTKLDYEDDYWDLVAEVSKHVYNLAFEYLRSTYHKAMPTKADTPPTALEWLLLLEHMFHDLEQAIHQIVRQPQRTMIPQPIDCLSAKVKRPDRFVRSAVRSAVRRGDSNVLTIDRIPIPTRLRTNRPRPNLDTPENRFLRHQLVLIRRRLATLYSRVADAARSSGQVRFKVAAARLQHLEARIAGFLRMEPFVSAAGLPPSSYSALVFRAAPGYREALQCCLILRLGLRIQADALHLPLKDLGELYEYWCVLELLELITAGTGGTFEPKSLIEHGPGGLALRLKKGRHLLLEVRKAGRIVCTMRYNPCIDSATGEQRPDILLTFHPQGWETPVEVVLDAKYRVAGHPDYVKRYGTPGPPEDAVNQLYRYRDAIVDDQRPPRRRIVEALALFPFRDSPTMRFSSNRLYQSLQQVGIGALPFLPSQTEYVEEWLGQACRRSGSHFAEHTVGVRLKDEELLNRAKMAEPVLVGVIGHGTVQWEWIQEHRLYLAPLSHIGKQRRLDIKWLAFFEPAGLTGRGYGAVRYSARVLGIQVLKRREINTPWASHSDPDQLYLLFHIDQPETLSHPIWNTDRHRVSFRWATRYSLEHARTMSELYLETEAERRLWEELKNAGIPFTTEAGRVSAINPDDPAGRTTFVLNNGLRIRYQGSGSFRAWNKLVGERFFSVADLRSGRIRELLSD
ncbi:MAG: DUF2357 domain-containing protein [Bacillota bacterium]